MAGLSEFVGEAACPVVVAKQEVMDQRDDTGSEYVRGYVCMTNKGKGYIEAKTRATDFVEDSAAHSLPLYLIRRLLDGGVDQIFIAESDSGIMYEYPAKAFDPESGQCFDVSNTEDWREIGVPVGVAEKWDKDDVSLTV